MLNENSVSIVTKRVINFEGTQYTIGGEHRTAYENSELGRKLLKEEVPEPYLSAILTIWGNLPTVVVSEDVNK